MITICNKCGKEIIEIKEGNFNIAREICIHCDKITTKYIINHNKI